MSPVFAARRRAEEFDSLVEGTSTGSVDAARYAELLELVGTLRDSTPVEPRPAFVADLRERLMTAAETELVPGAAPAATVQDRLTVPRRSPRERRLAAVVGGFALVGATTSMAVAAQSALPGDVLYPLKRAIENAHTGLSVDDEQKGSTLLANASGRLEEVDRLTRSSSGEVDVAAVEETLQVFTAQATEASDLLLAAYDADGDDEALTELQDFTDRSFDALNQLATGATDEVRDALVPVGNALAAIEAAVQQACPTCAVSLTTLPPWMLSAGETVGEGLTELITVGGDDGTKTDPKTDPGTSQGKGGKPSGGTSEKPSTPVGGDVPAVPAPGPKGGAGSTGGSGSAGSGSGSGAQDGKNAVDDLVDGLLGNGGSTTESPEVPIVGDVVEGVGEVVGGLVDPLKPTPTP